MCCELLGQCRDLLEPNDERRILSNEHCIPLDQRCDQHIFIDGGSAASQPQVDSYSESLRNQKMIPRMRHAPRRSGDATVRDYGIPAKMPTLRGEQLRKMGYRYG